MLENQTYDLNPQSMFSVISRIIMALNTGAMAMESILEGGTKDK